MRGAVCIFVFGPLSVNFVFELLTAKRCPCGCCVCRPVTLPGWVGRQPEACPALHHAPECASGWYCRISVPLECIVCLTCAPRFAGSIPPPHPPHPTPPPLAASSNGATLRLASGHPSCAASGSWLRTPTTGGRQAGTTMALAAGALCSGSIRDLSRTRLDLAK